MTCNASPAEACQQKKQNCRTAPARHQSDQKADEGPMRCSFRFSFCGNGVDGDDTVSFGYDIASIAVFLRLIAQYEVSLLKQGAFCVF